MHINNEMWHTVFKVWIDLTSVSVTSERIATTKTPAATPNHSPTIQKGCAFRLSSFSVCIVHVNFVSRLVGRLLFLFFWCGITQHNTHKPGVQGFLLLWLKKHVQESNRRKYCILQMHRSLARGTGCARMRISGTYFSGKWKFYKKKKSVLIRRARHLSNQSKCTKISVGCLSVLVCVCVCVPWIWAMLYRFTCGIDFFFSAAQSTKIVFTACSGILAFFSDKVWSGGFEGLVVSVCTFTVRERERKNTQTTHTITQSNSPRTSSCSVIWLFYFSAFLLARSPALHFTWHFEWLLGTHITWTSSLYIVTHVSICDSKKKFYWRTRLDPTRTYQTNIRAFVLHTRPINRLH